MISLKKYIESDQRELLNLALDAYRSALAATGAFGVKACPQVGHNMQDSLFHLVEKVSTEPTPAQVADTQRRVLEELQNWGDMAAEYSRQKASEVKEIMLIAARTAESVGERDQRYTQQFNTFSGRLQAIANLDDLTNIKSSLVQSAVELKTCVDKMARDSREAVAQMRTELTTYQTKLEEYERLALRDTLTGLDNRRSLESELEQRIARKKPFSVIMLDLNGLKTVNDQYGHLAGDELLKLFAAELKTFIRSIGSVGRWGGDEFLAILDCKLELAAGHLGRMQDWVFGEYTIKAGCATPRKVKITAATGLAAWTEKETVAHLIGRADSAMYKQKASTRTKLAPQTHAAV
ncbi:MAG TPA: GGDEF domain-containing protein [Bryobacteraceae bacterium]|nr:GGDEF domain-containing protein [Bryobacteraceae bacterium]